MIPKEVLAYCAGVIDSDGTIGIAKSTYKVRVVKDSTQPTYSARVCVRQVTREAVDLLAATFCGSVRLAKPSVERGRVLFAWEIKDAKAGRALLALLPYLRIKRLQALNCLALGEVIGRSRIARNAIGRGHVGAAKRPAEISEEMARLCDRAHELNRVGIP